jgi:xanthine dehydrogenase molybdopterin-binding subunit B
VDWVGILHDVGKSLNPVLDRSKIEGAFVVMTHDHGLNFMITAEALARK